MSEKLYEFDVVVCGWGNNPHEAWENAKEGLNVDRMELPEFTIIDEDESEDSEGIN